MSKRKKSGGATNIIFSYAPLLTGPAGAAFLGQEAVDNVKTLVESFEELPSGAAEACLWIGEEGRASAVFAMKDVDVDDVAEHFKHWAEGKPGEWFKFHYLEKGPSYACALIPDFFKSSERWKIAFQLRHGYPPESGNESFLFRPLHVVAKSRAAFDQIKGMIQSTVRVGLIDVEKIGIGQPQILPIEEVVPEVRWLGEFKTVCEELKHKKGLARGYLESQIEAMWESEKEAAGKGEGWIRVPGK